MYRSSHLEVFYKKGVLRNFAKFAKKLLCKSLFFNKVVGGACNFIKKETLTQVFSCEFCEISKNTFSCRTPLGDCFCTFFEVTKYYRIIKTLNVVRYLLSNCYFRFSSIIFQWTVGALVRSDKSPFQFNFFCILTNSFMMEAVII